MMYAHVCEQVSDGTARATKRKVWGAFKSKPFLSLSRILGRGRGRGIYPIYLSDDLTRRKLSVKKRTNSTSDLQLTERANLISKIVNDRATLILHRHLKTI
eukprot:1314368-Amorphochlora_amoeboformis.AAC.3